MSTSIYEWLLMTYADHLDAEGRNVAEANWYRSQVQELAVEWARTGKFPQPC